MIDVTNKWTTNDILARLNCHRTTVLRMAEELGIVAGRVGRVCLFDKLDAEKIIAEIKARQRKRSK